MVSPTRSIAVPAPPFDLKLSYFDRTLPPTHSKRILCFSLPQRADKERIIDQLHIALHYTVQRVPFLAGSIVPFSEEEGNRPWLRNVSPQGSAYLDIKDLSNSMSFGALAAANFDQELFDADQLCSLPQVAYIQEEPVEVCRIQANFIDGGLLLVIQINHVAIDGWGVTEVVKIFSEKFRDAQAGKIGHTLLMNEKTYVSDRRTLVSSAGNLGDLANHSALTQSGYAHANLEGKGFACRTFRIPTDALARLKKDASPVQPKDDSDWISTGDAIAALLWRSIIVARHRAGELQTRGAVQFGQPYDCRKLMQLPEPYFGNSIYFLRTDVQFADIANGQDGISLAARAIRSDVNAVTADKFRDMVGLIERTQKQTHTRLSFWEDLSTSAIMYTSHFAFDMHAMDFGELGRIQAFRQPPRGSMIGQTIVMPRLRDGSCEFLLTETPQVFVSLAEDDIWSQYVDKSPSQPSNPMEVAVTVAVDKKLDLVSISTAPPTLNSFSRTVPNRDLSATARSAEDDNPPTPMPALINISDVQAPHVGCLRILELNRPRAKNAISHQLLDELARAIEDVWQQSMSMSIDPSSPGPASKQVRALIITSSSDTAFCAGADLKERKAMTLAETQLFLAKLRATFARLAALPVPTIACVAGVALGGGLELALSCHMRVFASNAVVGLPETRLAIIPGAGGTYRLQQVVGRAHALDMILTGRKVDAVESLRLGLCSRLVQVEEVDCLNGEDLARRGGGGRLREVGLALAQEITRGGPSAIRAVLGAISAASEEAENLAYEVVLRSSDRLVALEQFGTGRQLTFAGR
ncbi:putative enoyl-CoA hydratase/isomerase family protein [Cadophora sp. DSE1049]|nr:putative enoyl-CoA hydratase/isomerase family protein [Cadophora sp. DSE1049]